MSKKSHESYSKDTSRYPKTAAAREKNRKKGRVVGVLLGLAGTGTVAFAATHSGPVSESVHEALRSSPNPVAERLSEADYQVSVAEKAQSNVQDVLRDISDIKFTLKSTIGAETGNAESDLSGSTQKSSLEQEEGKLHYSTSYEFSGITDIRTGDIEVTHDNQGTLIAVSHATGGDSNIPGTSAAYYEQKIVFRNPDEGLAVDLADLPALASTLAGPETTVQSVSAKGDMKDQDDYDTSWYTYDTPLTVTFERTDDGFEARSNTEILETPYGVSSKNTPTMEDILKFEFKDR